MRLEQLSYLVEISKTKSISLAAERMYISQPSLSEAINKLEKELGVTLLQRSHRGVDLTEDGAKVVEASEQVLEIMDKLKTDLGVHSGIEPSQLTGVLSIYTTPDIGATVLMNALDVYCQDYPNVNLTVKEFDILDLMQHVIEGRADLGIIPMLVNLLEDDQLSDTFKNEIHFEKLFSTKSVCLVGRFSPLASRKSVSMKEIVDRYPLVVYSTHSIDFWFNKLLDKYGDPKIYLKSGSVELVEKAVTRGSAVGLSTELYLKREDKQNLFKNKEIIAIPIKDDIRISVGLIRPINSQLSPAAQEFIKVLKSQC